MSERKIMPPKPTMQYMESPDQAIAQAVNKLTDSKSALEMLSCLDENDVPRIALMLSLGQDPDLNLTWLEDYAYTELKLMCSTKQKQGGIRSVQVVEVAKQPPMMAQPEGILGGIRRRLGGR